MTATAVAVDEVLAHGLHAEPEYVQHPEPDADAPEQGERQADVDVHAVPLRLRVHCATILSSVVAVQVAWLAALAYGLYSIVR